MKARAVTVGIVLALSSWMLADVSVVNEKKILSPPADKDSGWVPGENMGLGSARLSPDGTKLLYLHRDGNAAKPEGYEGRWSGRVYRLALPQFEDRPGEAPANPGADLGRHAVGAHGQAHLQ